MMLLVLVLFVNSLLFIVNQSNVLSYLFNLNPENTSGTLIVFSLIGAHSFFAILTMFLSFNGSRFAYRYYSAGLSFIAPIIFLIINFRTIISYQTDSYYFLPFSLLTFLLFTKKNERLQIGVNLYLKILINPLGTPWY